MLQSIQDAQLYFRFVFPILLQFILFDPDFLCELCDKFWRLSNSDFDVTKIESENILD